MAMFTVSSDRRTASGLTRLTVRSHEGGLVFRPEDFPQADAAAHRMVERAIALDGTCTGEHGVGLGKREYLESELGTGTVQMMKRIKTLMDPNWILNPGSESMVGV